MKKRRTGNENPSISVEVAGAAREAAFTDDSAVLEALLECDIEISHSCGGMGTCGTCRIEILSPLDELHERNELETEMALDRSFAAHERLACQLLAFKGLKLRIPK